MALYQWYVNNGFERHELNCSIEKQNTGYGGFSLTKRINKKMLIEVHSSELDKPKLYIVKSKDQETYHIVHIKIEIVESLLFKNGK
jgi:hypothetical protein